MVRSHKIHVRIILDKRGCYKLPSLITRAKVKSSSKRLKVI